MEAATPPKAAKSDNRVWRRVKENGVVFWALRDPESGENGSELGLAALPVDILLDITSLLDFPSVKSLGLTCAAFRSLLSANKTLWINQLHKLSKNFPPAPIPTFREVTTLSVEELINTCKTAFHLSNTWSNSPTPRRSIQIWSVGVKSQVAVQRLVRTGSHHWLFVASTTELEDIHTELSIFDLQCNRKAASFRVKGAVQDMVVDLVTPKEATVAIALCASEDEETHWEPDNPQHSIIVYSVKIPSGSLNHATSFSETFRVFTPYVLCNICVRGAFVGGLAWEDGISPTHAFLVNWQEKAAGMIDLLISEPVYEPITFLVDKTTFLVYEERHTTPVIHAYLIPTLLKPNRTVPVMSLLNPAPVPHITAGPSSFPKFASQIVGPAPDGRISVFSASLEDHDEVDESGLHIKSTIIHRYLEPEANPEPEGPRVVYRPALPTYHYKSRLHHTYDHPFHHPYILSCLGATGNRAIWMEINRKPVHESDSSSGSDSDDDRFDHKRKVEYSLATWSLCRPQPAETKTTIINSPSRQLLDYVNNEAEEHVGQLVLPPSLKLQDCPSMAFDEATGMICLGTKRGEIWVLNYG